MGVSKHDWPDDDQLVADVVAAGGPNRYALLHGIAVGTVYGHLDKRSLRGRVLEEAGGRVQSAVAAAREVAENAVAQVSAIRTGAKRPGAEVRGDNATIISDPSPELGDLEALIRERGLDPEDWEVVNAKLNEWDALARGGEEPEVVKLRQLTVNLRRRTPIHFVFPARDVEQRPVIRVIDAARDEPELVVLVPDPHAPYQDEGLHETFREWLHTNEPHRGILLGDTMDLPTISRHRDDPAWAAPVQECVDAAFSLLSDYVAASSGTRWVKLLGNHDERLRNELLQRAERMYGVRPAAIDGEEQDHLTSVRRLLHLDRLNIELIEPPNGGGYSDTQYDVCPGLGARHGWIVKNAAEGTLDKLGHSVIVGHTHRQKIHFKTTYGWGGRQTLQAVEAGTMRRIDGGGGYAIAPDWQNGFATATVWPDGHYELELARYRDGVLTWRDQRFSI